MPPAVVSVLAALMSCLTNQNKLKHFVKYQNGFEEPDNPP